MSSLCHVVAEGVCVSQLPLLVKRLCLPLSSGLSGLSGLPYLSGLSGLSDRNSMRHMTNTMTACMQLTCHLLACSHNKPAHTRAVSQPLAECAAGGAGRGGGAGGGLCGGGAAGGAGRGGTGHELRIAGEDEEEEEEGGWRGAEA